jgi:zinc-finger protein CreA/MIG
MLRRVEHATRHAEILQSFGRLSKSAATSPVATPYLSGRSAMREYFDPEIEDDNDSALPSHRHASGGWTHDVLPPSYGTTRTVDGEQRRRAPNTWASRSQSNSYSNPSVFVPSDDSPSPRSTDEDLPTPAQMSATGRTTGAYMTPSTSPFLGGLSTLHIHSTQPSRAPSPITLPPPATRPGSPGDDFQRRRGGAPDSPPITFTAGRKRRSSGDYEPYRCALLILISIWSN